MSCRMLSSDERSQRLIRAFRAVVDTYPGQRVMVGEVYILDTARGASYCGNNQLILAFNSPPMRARAASRVAGFPVASPAAVVAAGGPPPSSILVNPADRP